MTRHHHWPSKIFVAWLCTSIAVSAQVVEHRIVILSHDTNDIRLPMTLEAIKFWNETASQLGIGVRIVENVIIASSAERALENYARLISHRAGRLSPGPSEPDAPEEITEFDSNVVLLLSRQDLMSFAWPLPRKHGHFVAIEEDLHAMARNPNIARNIIAHEIGHTLGLSHNNDPMSLMCGPCRTNDLPVDSPEYMHLTAVDQKQLSAHYPSR